MIGRTEGIVAIQKGLLSGFIFFFRFRISPAPRSGPLLLCLEKSSSSKKKNNKKAVLCRLTANSIRLGFYDEVKRIYSRFDTRDRFSGVIKVGSG